MTNPLARLRRRAGSQKHGYGMLLSDTVIYGGGRSLVKLLHALLLPLYSYYLTPADYGLLGLVLTTATLIDVFVTLGFDVAFTRFYFDEDSDANHRRVITTVFYVKFFYGGLLLAVVAFFCPQIAELVTGDADNAIYFQVALINIFFTNWSDLPYTLFRLDHRPWTFTVFTLGRVLVQVPVTVAFVVWLDQGPMGVLIGNAVSAALLNFAALPTYWKRLDWRPDRRHMGAMMDFAWPAIFSTLSFYVLRLADRYFFVRFSTIAELGLYTVAQSLSQPVYLVMMAFRMAWPQWHFAKLKEPELHKQMVARSSTYFLGFCLFMGAFMGVFMPIIVRLLLTKEAFWGVGPTTLVLAFATIAYAAYFVFWVGSNVAKKNRLIPVIAAVAGGLTIGLNFVLIPAYGMWGAAWSHLAGYALLALMVYFYSSHYYPIRFEWARLLRLCSATGVTLLGAWLLGQAVGLSTDLPFTEVVVRQIAVAPAILLFPLVLWLERFFTPGEQQKLSRLLGRRAARRAAAAGGGPGSGVSGAREAVAGAAAGGVPSGAGVRAAAGWLPPSGNDAGRSPAGGSGSDDELALEEELAEGELDEEEIEAESELPPGGGII